MSLSTCVLLRSWAIRRLVLSFHGRGWGSRGRSQCTEEFGLGISELRKCCWGAMPVVVFWSVTRCFRWFWKQHQDSQDTTKTLKSLWFQWPMVLVQLLSLFWCAWMSDFEARSKAKQAVEIGKVGSCRADGSDVNEQAKLLTIRSCKI